MLLREFILQYGPRAHGLNGSAVWSLYRGLRDLSSLRERGFERVHAGPGGGVRVSPFTAAYLLAGALAGATRGDAATAAWETWHLLGSCPGTGDAAFGDALNTILAHPETAAVVRGVTLLRSPTREARITWLGMADSVFVEDPSAAARARCEEPFRVAATIGGATLRTIAGALSASANENGRPAARSAHRASPRDADERGSSPREPAPRPKPLHSPLSGSTGR